jgi:hypothetical protein
MILWRRGHVSAGRPALEATTANMEEVVEWSGSMICNQLSIKKMERVVKH